MIRLGTRGPNYFAGPGYTWGLGLAVREAKGISPMGRHYQQLVRALVLQAIAK
jgi:hypothetical protein